MEDKFNIKTYSDLYHALDNTLKKIISKHVEIGRKPLKVLIFGLVTGDKYMSHCGILWDRIYNDECINANVLSKFGDEYVKLLDIIYDGILEEYDIHDIIIIYSDIFYLNRNPDNYRSEYLSRIQYVINKTLSDFQCLSVDKDRMMEYIQKKLSDIKRNEMWLYDFDWTMNMCDNMIQIKFSDIIGGKNECHMMFDVKNKPCGVKWDL